MALKRKRTYFTADDIKTSADQRILEINHEFLKKIDDPDYPCLGAKSALHTHQYRMGMYGLMGKEETTAALGDDLKTYIQETIAADSQYMSMIAVFTDHVHSELDFEKRLWMQLQKLHDSENPEQPWDPAVGSDPENNDFSFSFNCTACFILVLHSNSSRKARTFGFPPMACNLHRQFQQLREHDNDVKMKQTIRNREINYDSTFNPMISDHSEGLKTPQYSGRKVD